MKTELEKRVLNTRRDPFAVNVKDLSTAELEQALERLRALADRIGKQAGRQMTNSEQRAA